MTDPRVLHELLKMNPPFALLIQAAYMQGNSIDKANLYNLYTDIIKELPKS